MLNVFTGMGRLTKDPEIKTTQSGKSVTTFTIAVDRDFDRGKADFFHCVAWNRLADVAARYLKKGQLVVVTGSMQSREWTDRNGNNRTMWEVNLSNVHFTEPKKEEPQFDDLDDEEAPF